MVKDLFPPMRPRRAKAVTDIAAKIIDNANTVLDAKKLQSETLGRSNVTIPKMLED